MTSGEEGRKEREGEERVRGREAGKKEEKEEKEDEEVTRGGRRGLGNRECEVG